MKKSCFLLLVASSLSAFAQMQPPLNYHLEEKVLDGKSYQALVFSSIPGVSHRVEHSSDLQNWQPVTEGIYGLGQDYAVAMVESIAIGGASSGGAPSPSPAIHSLSVALRPGSPSGVVISWFDSAAGQSVDGWVPGSLDPAWGQSPLAVWEFGNTRLVTFASLGAGSPIPSPLVPQNPAAQDVFDLVALHLATMNADVALSATQVTTTIGPPAEPGEREFFRVVSDFSLDSDGDGSLDWLEWQMVNSSGGGAGGLNGAVASPFLYDSNGDGIADGLQLDADEDGIPDHNDPVPHDSRIDWMSRAMPRFAIFPVAVVNHTAFPEAYPYVMGNDRGEVLVSQPLDVGAPEFPPFLWRAGNAQPIPKASTRADQWDHVTDLDNYGNVLGSAAVLPFPDVDQSIYTAHLWHGAVLSPKRVGAANEQVSFLLSDTGTITRDNNEFGRVSWDWRVGAWVTGLSLAEDGESFALGAPQTVTYQLGQGGFAGITPMTYAGTSASHPATGVQIEVSSGISDPAIVSPPHFATDLSSSCTRLCPTPSGGWLAVQSANPSLLSSKQGGDWSDAGVEQLGDLARNGVGLRLGPYNRFDYSVEPFWYEGASYTSATMIPGLSPLHFAPDHAKLTNAGHLVAIELEEAIGRTSIYLGSPFSVSDAEWASGVDDLSLQASDATTGVEDKYWIMVPVDGSNTFQLDSLAGPMQQYELEVPQGQCVPAAATTRQSQIAISALAGPATVLASENTLGLKLSDGVHQSQALNSPIGLKTMPKRNITVGLWPVKDGNGAGPAIGGDEGFRAALDADLDDIFGKQANVFFDVTLEAAISANWDIGEGAEVGFIPESALVSGDGVLHVESAVEKDVIHSSVDEFLYDINIFIIQAPLIHGTTKLPVTLNGQEQGFRQAAGDTDRQVRRVWVSGNPSIVEMTQEAIVRTCVHEIGHVLIEVGHPDQGGGAAPLPGVDHRRRLMVSAAPRSGVTAWEVDKLLVKQEWDAIAETIERAPELQD